MKCCLLLSPEELVVLLPSSVLRYQDFFQIPPSSWKASYIIYPLSVDLGPPFVGHAGHFSSACPINRLLKPFVSCSNQGSTIQGSFPH